MNANQRMINQMNAILSFLPETDKRQLPQKLIDFFSKNADCSPEETLDTSLPLEKQDLDDETLLMLYYIGILTKEKRQG